MIKTEPVPCVVTNANSEVPIEEDSLAENFQREDLHPLDMFRAFQTLHDQGASHEEIAARFFVSATFVQQRLRPAKVSPKLHEVYEQEGMQLEQLMAFTVTDDHARQEQVWEALENSWSREPQQIRRLLTETTVRATDRRALFVGRGVCLPPAAWCCATCSSPTMAAGCRSPFCSTAWSGTSSSPPPTRSRKRVGNGSSSMSICPMATITACGHWPAPPSI